MGSPARDKIPDATPGTWRTTPEGRSQDRDRADAPGAPALSTMLTLRLPGELGSLGAGLRLGQGVGGTSPGPRRDHSWPDACSMGTLRSQHPREWRRISLSASLDGWVRFRPRHLRLNIAKTALGHGAATVHCPLCSCLSDQMGLERKLAGETLTRAGARLVFRDQGRGLILLRVTIEAVCRAGPRPPNQSRPTPTHGTRPAISAARVRRPRVHDQRLIITKEFINCAYKTLPNWYLFRKCPSMLATTGLCRQNSRR